MQRKYIQTVLKVKQRVSRIFTRPKIDREKVGPQKQEKQNPRNSVHQQKPSYPHKTPVHKKGSSIAQMVKKFERWRNQAVATQGNPHEINAQDQNDTQDNTKQPCA